MLKTLVTPLVTPCLSVVPLYQYAKRAGNLQVVGLGGGQGSFGNNLTSLGQSLGSGFQAVK